jgi:deazaflavin-dependent oxidoreductase (nitroreductase family)
MDTSSMESDSGIARSLGYFPAVVYRWMQRRVRARVKSARILLLTTTGVDSGEPQTVAMGYFEDGPDLVVIASNYGSDQHPTWYRNMRARPLVGVQIEENLRQMVASTATTSERTQLRVRLAVEDKQYGRYQRNTAREIPIVLLRPTKLVSTGQHISLMSGECLDRYSEDTASVAQAGVSVTAANTQDHWHGG